VGAIFLAYNVFLFNGLIASSGIGASSLTQAQLDAITRKLQGNFTQVVNKHDALAGAKGTKFGTALVRWITEATVVAPHELLIYLMPFGATVAKNGKLEMGAPPANHDGLTNPMAGGVASEVYLHFVDMDIIANLMFHEAMHNKLALDNGMHSKGGLAGSPVSASTTLTPGNMQDMAQALETRRPQWTGGIPLLIAESKRSDNDPLKGLQ
jgi:hypothetical protein